MAGAHANPRDGLGVKGLLVKALADPVVVLQAVKRFHR